MRRLELRTSRLTVGRANQLRHKTHLMSIGVFRLTSPSMYLVSDLDAGFNEFRSQIFCQRVYFVNRVYFIIVSLDPVANPTYKPQRDENLITFKEY